MVLLSSGCNRLTLYTYDKGELIASVGENELYTSDIEGMIEPGMAEKDSLSILQSIVESWVRKEIKNSTAEAALSEYGADIEQMVAQYRGALLTYKYEEQWLTGRLDTAVTASQISDYYNTNRNGFRLAGPIVKARIARIPAGLRQSRKLEDMFRSKDEDDEKDFLNICEKNEYHIDDFSSQWSDFSSVIQQLPFSQRNFDDFLRSRTYYEVEDDQHKYMMSIISYRPTGDYSPLERETNNIRKIILNKRRQSLLSRLDDSLYTDAKKAKTFEIFEVQSRQ